MSLDKQSVFTSYRKIIVEIIDNLKSFLQLAGLGILSMASILFYYMISNPTRDHTNLIYVLFGLTLALVILAYLDGVKLGLGRWKDSAEHLRFIQGVKGYWWNYPYYDSSLLGIVAFKPLPRGSLSMEGVNYNREGDEVGIWSSEAGWVDASKNTFYHFWEGLHPNKDGKMERFQGFTKVVFEFPMESKSASSARNLFFEINTTDPDKVSNKVSRLEPCTPEDYMLMKSGKLKRIELVSSRLASSVRMQDKTD